MKEEQAQRPVRPESRKQRRFVQKTFELMRFYFMTSRWMYVVLIILSVVLESSSLSEDKRFRRNLGSTDLVLVGDAELKQKHRGIFANFLTPQENEFLLSFFKEKESAMTTIHPGLYIVHLHQLLLTHPNSLQISTIHQFLAHNRCGNL